MLYNSTRQRHRSVGIHALSAVPALRYASRRGSQAVAEPSLAQAAQRERRGGGHDITECSEAWSITRTALQVPALRQVAPLCARQLAGSRHVDLLLRNVAPFARGYTIVHISL